MPWLIGGLVIILMLFAAAVGSALWYINGPRAEQQARERAHAAKVAADKAERRRQATCERLLNEAYTRLREIDSRLNVGMVEADFSSAVGTAQAAYDRIDPGAAHANDCAAYDDLRKALGQYRRAADYWNDCITSYYCTPSDTKLNNWWGEASVLLSAVKVNGLGYSSESAS